MYQSSVINIGVIALGGNNPIRIQSMTTTKTMDTAATVEQVKNLAKSGCDFVRVTTQNIREAKNLLQIRKELKKNNIEIPLIADVHFNPKVAEIAARYVEKVRINPGNYNDIDDKSLEDNLHKDKYVLQRIEKNLTPLLDICKQNNTVIRIGTNHGSLSERILQKYGNTARGLVESLMEFVQVCNKNDFHNLVLSIKASNTRVMIESNLLLIEKLSEAGLKYPLHLGVTEAGSDEDGRIKSAAGIGYLLAHGIGDTIRVSLTESPLAEIPIAKKIVDFYGKRKNISGEIKPETIIFRKAGFVKKYPVVITSGHSSLSDLSIESTASREPSKKNVESVRIVKFVYSGISYDELIIKAAVEVAIILYTQEQDGIWIENAGTTSPDNLAKLALNILQVMGLRISKTEYTACPTCGRSSINIIKQLEEIKKQTSHLPGLKIAVMGCNVNGPGEMAGADYGFVASGKGFVNIYKGKNVIYRNVLKEQAISTLINLIKIGGDWKDIH